MEDCSIKWSSSSSPARSRRPSTSRRKAISRAPCMLQYTSARSILNVTLPKMPNAVSLPLCYEVSCQVGIPNSTERETRFILKSKCTGNTPCGEWYTNWVLALSSLALEGCRSVHTGSGNEPPARWGSQFPSSDTKFLVEIEQTEIMINLDGMNVRVRHPSRGRASPYTT